MVLMAMRNRTLAVLLVATALACFAIGCGATATKTKTGSQSLPVASTYQSESTSTTASTPARRHRTRRPRRKTPGVGPALGRPTKSSGCHVRGQLPDPACTPGSVFASATVSQICTPGYSSSVRDVPDSVKEQVYAAYGIYSHTAGSFEVDHLVSLELGGDNSVANLWPEVSPGFHEKDTIENELHADICSGRVALAVAQRQIARDWRHTAAGEPHDLPRRPPPPPSTPTGGGTASGFCTTHTCIPSFDEGHGTIVQCADGEWSHSGGLPGVCSHHGGAR
jgi:hypothetical protein